MVRVVYEAGNWPPAQYVFEDKAAYETWARDIESIKKDIERINKKIEAEGRAGEGTKADYQRWILLVEAAIVRYEKDFIPADIRWALNDVERGLGLTLTTWPTMVDVVWVS